jgi:hypothetical protein
VVVLNLELKDGFALCDPSQFNPKYQDIHTHLEAPVRVLREPGDLRTVVHAVGGGVIKISTVANSWSLHGRVACGVGILVINTEKEGIEGLVGRS